MIEEQQAEAVRRTQQSIDHRPPKFLGWFERFLARGANDCVFGSEHSYADLSLFQLWAGLHDAYPSAMAATATQCPGVRRARDRVAERPRIREYLASPRRLAFNEHGLFRRDPELDLAPGAK